MEPEMQDIVPIHYVWRPTNRDINTCVTGKFEGITRAFGPYGNYAVMAFRTEWSVILVSGNYLYALVVGAIEDDELSLGDECTIVFVGRRVNAEGHRPRYFEFFPKKTTKT